MSIKFRKNVTTDKEIFVHIGMHKTGSTSIQQMLYQNAKLLREHGIYYPTISQNHGIFLYSMFLTSPEKWGENIWRGYTTPEKVREINAQYTAIIEREIQNPAIKKVIFSGEDLSVLSFGEIKKFSDWLLTLSNNITIICTVRNPVDWYNSCIQETLKPRYHTINSACEYYVNELNQDVPRYKHLRDYIDCFGRDAVKVFSFDQHKLDLCQYFLKLCYFEPSLIEMLAKSFVVANASLSQEASFLLDRLNFLRPRANDVPAEIYSQELHCIDRIKGKKFKLPNAVLKKLLCYFKEDIEWISENFQNECGTYIDSVRNSNEERENITSFQDSVMDQVVILISDLARENYKFSRSLQEGRSGIKKIINRVLKKLKSKGFS